MSPDAVASGGVPPSSSRSMWMRFSWNTALLPPLFQGGETLIIRPAAKEESQKVLEVILNSLLMDSAWNDSYLKVESYLKQSVERLFSKEQPLCMVIPKGNRFIAASLIEPVPEASLQLLSGPVVLTEYRNRGLGSQLLHASLLALRDREFSMVSGVTRSGLISARHVYTKFGGVGEPFHLSSLADGSQEIKSPTKDPI